MDDKVGDITPGGFEVYEIEYTPRYKLRKRILITSDTLSVGGKNLKGVFGYYYNNSPGFYWVQLDDGNSLKLREDEFEFVPLQK